MSRFQIAGLAVAAVTLLASNAAFAHAHLKTSVPAANAVLTKAPSEVAIDFSEGLEAKFSSIEVQDAQGKRVDKNDVHTAATDNKHLEVSLPQLAPGTYKVTWHATATDTHKTQGNFDFTISK